MCVFGCVGGCMGVCVCVCHKEALAKQIQGINDHLRDVEVCICVCVCVCVCVCGYVCVYVRDEWLANIWLCADCKEQTH